MGTKRTWKGKYIFLYIACITATMVFGILGCTHFIIKQQDKQQGKVDIARTNVPMENGDNAESPFKDIKEVLSLFPEFAKEWQGKQGIEKARTLMLKGDYEAAIKCNEEVLRQFPRTLGDQALFEMGLIYAHAENPNPDNQKAIECFQSIIEEFPNSSMREEAGIWILFLEKTIEDNKRFDKLQHQKENLKDQIEKLKEIDLGIEDKKRIDLPE